MFRCSWRPFTDYDEEVIFVCCVVLELRWGPGDFLVSVRQLLAEERLVSKNELTEGKTGPEE